MKIMYPKEGFSGYNNEELSFIDKKFSDIFKIERDLLLNIFECRDSINHQISCLSVKEKVTESQRELLNALLDSKRDLFNKFFINYCKSKDLLKFSENFSDKLEKYEEIDDSVRYSLGVKIFNNVSKDNVLNFFDKPLEYDDIYVFVDDFVSSFVDSIEDYLSTFLYEGASEQIFKDFVIYFKNILSKFVKSKISKKVNIDLNDLFTLVSDIVFSSVTNDVLIGIYYEFLVLQKYPEFLEKNVSAFGDDYINYDFDDNEVVVPCVSLLLRRTGINDSDILNKSGGPVFYKREIENDIKDFVTNGLDIGKSFEDMDDYKFFEKMYTFHLDGSQYEKWKNMFLKRIKFPVKTGDLKLMNIEDSDDIVRYISSLRDEYPKAKDYIGKIGAHKLKDMKVDFLKLHFGGLLDELSDLLDNKVYKESSIVQLFKIMYIYLGILKGSKFTLDDDFVEYIKEFLKKSFRESHQSVENKKKYKDNVVKGNLGKDSLPQAESLGKLEIPAEKESIDRGFSKKDILPQKLLEDLDFYFKSVDTEFSDDEKRAIIAAIKKLPYRSLSEKEPKKYYKKSWFKTFKLNDIFFEILDNNGYICEPDNVEEVEVPTEIIESPVISIDPLFLKIQKFLSKISKCDDIEGKVDICIDELTSLGYSFYKGKLKFKNRLIELFKSNPNFFTAFSNTMTSLLQGSVFFEKKAKKYDSKSVYGLDIGGKTGFRLVVLEGKSIFDIMEHGFYENFLDKKCSGK